MDIKIFDIVYCHSYLGRYRGRVMSELKRLNSFAISSCGVAEMNRVELIESITLPTLEIGDVVKVLPIPHKEKQRYPLGWTDDMTKFVNQQDDVHMVTDVNEQTPYGKPSYQLDNAFWFCPYHLEKIESYDMV